MSLPSEQEQKNHVDYFDYLRVVAMVSVVFMHAAAALLRGSIGLQWELLNICVSFAYTAVPLFVMMSGYLLLSSEKTTDIAFLLRKRLPRLFFPLAAWTVAAVLQRLSSQGALSWESFRFGMLQSFYEPAAIHLWYMYLLIALYVLSPFLYGAVQCLDGRGRRFAFLLIALVTVHEVGRILLPDNLNVFVSFDLLFRLKLYDGYLCTFLLGYLLGSMKRKIPNRVLIPAAAALWAAIAVGTHYLSVHSGMYVASYQKQGAGLEVMLAGCLFLLFKQNVKKSPEMFRTVPVLPLSLPIYLTHGVLLAVFQSAGYYPGSFLGVLRLTALLFAVSYLVSKSLATVKPLCFLFTGMSYQAACQSSNWIYTYQRIRARLCRRKK